MTVHLTITHEQAKSLAALLNAGCSMGAVNNLGFSELQDRLNESIGEFKFEYPMTTFNALLGGSENYSIIPVDAGGMNVYIDVT